MGDGKTKEPLVSAEREVEVDAETAAAIERGIRAADEGRVVSAEEVRMGLEDQLTMALIDSYGRIGENATSLEHLDYEFVQDVRTNGGVATARKILGSDSARHHARFEAFLKAGRPDLTMEAIILQPQFSSLFSYAERKVARDRLGHHAEDAARLLANRARIYPDELEPGQDYLEGARKQILVNAYERDPEARAACLRHHGFRCACCSLLFEERYGDLGKDFIHVHHLKPLALSGAPYRLDPVKDLVPVCPNCHAMLHRPHVVLTVEELKARIAKATSAR